MIDTPQILLGASAGYHNLNDASVERVARGRQYRDLSTVCVIPAIANIPPRVVESWWELLTPLNQRFRRVFVTGLEVGDAYERALNMILEHPELSGYRYVLTLEHDNMPPPTGLLKLYESIDGFAAVGGLYWRKGEEGQPMIFGSPGASPDFAPQVPAPDCLQECNGLGMGFTLFDLDVFRDQRIPRPWFRTVQGHWPEYGPFGYTHDLYFFKNLLALGYRVACDTRVKVGHYESETGIVW